MERVVVVAGPTGIGKTKLSVTLALFLGSEVINGDAFQIYKGMNIGTAKVTEEEKKGVVHHLFDIVDIDETFSVQEYQKLCREKIKEINEKGKIPVIVGGTGLYLKAALYDYEFKEEDTYDMSMYESLSNEQLYDKLKEIDEVSALKTHPNNRKRVLRYLQICLSSNEKKSDIEAKQDHKLIYDALFIGLQTDRKTLYDRCDKRVDIMLEQGLEKEVKDIYDKYHTLSNLTSMQAIGYKELFEYYDGKISKEEAIELIKKRTRNYVKRQYTWFTRQVNANWIDVNFEDFSKTEEIAIKLIKEWL